ncbi:MAG TPA: glycosyltransferase family A protein [Solirubrobacteraceae bacterium]|nr:glycosyltransferase family A protein [Solirubrobacteraceae bacterium]
MAPNVTVALPVLDGGPLLGEVLAAVRAQDVDRPVELLVVDSGSRDGSPELARRHGARVVDIPPHEFGHGRTRNRLMELSTGDHVAFLTQDSTPAHERWLAALLDGFGDGAALVFGPHRPRPDASPMVRRELLELFDRIEGVETFFSSANGAVARWAWERVPFRDIAYAEDMALARDMQAVGLTTAYAPGAEVLHSHDHPPLRAFKRYFDDFRAQARVNGLREPLTPRYVAARVRNDVAADRAFMRHEGLEVQTGRSFAHHVARALGRSLGTNWPR